MTNLIGARPDDASAGPHLHARAIASPNAPTEAKTAASATTGILSCVVDTHPRFHLEALRWFASTTRLASIDPANLVVHVVGDGGADVRAYLERHGVSVRDIEPFDARSPHCNKVAGALALARDHTAGLCVLTDSDVAIVEDPRSLGVPPDQVGMKPVDMANPPLEVLGAVFAAAGILEPRTVGIPWQAEVTFSGNGNGGVYLVPGGILPDVARAWNHWARWLLDRLELLRDWAQHVDQVSMALALAAEGIDVFELAPRWNTPIHIDGFVPRDAQVPAIIHYHQRVDHIGQIEPIGLPAVDDRIHRVNAAMGSVWAEAFPNATFWDWRYATNPTLGSGVGSRGVPLESKRRLLRSVVEVVRPSSVLDVGCGDGEATRALPLPGYVGIDLSKESIARASAGRPDGRYRVGTLGESHEQADLTLCLDVLIHQADAAQYRRLVAELVESTRTALVVSGYQRPFTTTSPMVFFHEPLEQTVAHADPNLEIYPLRAEHEVTTFLALSPPPVRHPRDFSSASLRQVIGRHPNPLRLCDIRRSSWQTVGFYPDHAPRLWEYPAVADIVESAAPPGASIIDVGAGVSPLAPYLTLHGFSVDTLDPSPVHRSLPPGPECNEWDFLDYAAAGLARRSWNCPLHEVPAEHRYHVAYSVSVIEHLPAADRRALLSEMARRLLPSGVVILTVDLTRGTDILWNRVRGEQVEDDGLHGNFQDLVEEVSAQRLTIVGAETVRGWGDVPVDIGLVVASRP